MRNFKAMEFDVSVVLSRVINRIAVAVALCGVSIISL